MDPRLLSGGILVVPWERGVCAPRGLLDLVDVAAEEDRLLS